VQHKLSAPRRADGRDNAHFDTELVGLVGLALADAFDLGGVERKELPAAPPAILRQHAAAVEQFASEQRVEIRPVRELALDVARDTAEIAFV